MATNTYVALDKQTLVSNAANVYFTGIPQGYTDLVLVASVKTVTYNGVNLNINVNSDAGSNYSWTSISGNGTSPSSTRQINQSYADGDTSSIMNTSTFAQYNISFNNYSNTTTYKTILSRAGNSAVATDAVINLWRSTVAINAISFDCGADLFAIGSTFSLYGIKAEGVSPAAKATGGAIYSDDTYYYHVFGSTGTFTPLSSLTADVLVVAGGGSGSIAGGGAGGVLAYSSQSLTATGYACTVGAGGAAASFSGANGTYSQFGSLTVCDGGGRGGTNTSSNYNGQNGGSGGGAGFSSVNPYTQGTAGTATSGQGSNGGLGATSGSTTSAGGGGGLGGTPSTPTAGNGGAGGIGANTVTNWGALSSLATATGIGVNGYIAGGGGGQGDFTGGTGGTGGGGDGKAGSTTGANAVANTGSGGGGGYTTGGNGGSGIVIVRYTKA